jgi:transcriptional regulator with XRE-family HTH domain
MVLDSGQSDFARRFGAALKQRRNELGLSQEQIAERAGISAKYLGRIERAEVNASLDTIERVVLVLKPRQRARISKTWTSSVVAQLEAAEMSLGDTKMWLKAAVADRS